MSDRTTVAEDSLRTELETRLLCETLIADLSSKFINLPAEQVDREIEDAQRRVCESLGLDLTGLWELDCNAGVFWATERARAIFGYTSEEVIGMERFEASVLPDGLQVVRQAIKRALKDREPINVEYRIRLGDGGM